MAGEEGGVDVEGAMGREGEGPAGEDEAVGGDNYDIGVEGLQIRAGIAGGKGSRLEDWEAEAFSQEFDGGLGGLLSSSGGAVGLGVDAYDLRPAVRERPEGWDCEVGGAHEDAAQILKVWGHVNGPPPPVGICRHYRGRSRGGAKGVWVG